MKSKNLRKLGTRLWHIPRAYYFAVPLVLLLCFTNKPFHIEDALMLQMADLLPWQVFGDATGTVTYQGQIHQALSAYESTHPILIPYLLKLAGIFAPAGSYRFWVFHGLFLIFPLLVLHFCWRMAKARHITPHWGWHLVLSPLFFVLATNLMRGVVMLAFWVGTLFAAIAFVENRRNRDAFAAGIGLSCALLTSYQSVLLLPLLACYFFVCRIADRRTWLILAIPAGLFAGYVLLVYSFSSYLPFVSSALDQTMLAEIRSGLEWRNMLRRTTYCLTFLGLALLIPTPLLVTSLNRRRLLESVVFSAILTFAVFHLCRNQLFMTQYSQNEVTVLRALMMVGGFWTFMVLAKLVDSFRLFFRNRRRSGNLMLPATWFLGVLAFNILALPFGAAHYLLPALPPALYLLFIKGHYRFYKPLEIPLLVMAAGLCVLMAAVDYRQALADFQIFKSVQRGEMEQVLWYSDDGGLNRYLKPTGARYIPRDQTQVAIGDQVLLTRGLIHPELIKHLTLEQTLEIPAFAGITLFDTSHHAGFYRGTDGLLPLAFAEHARTAKLYRQSYFQHPDILAKAQLKGSDERFGFRNFDLPSGETRGGMSLHPQVAVGFPLGDQAYQLKGHVINAPEAWDKSGDGVTLEVAYRNESGGMHLLLELHLDAKNNPADRSGKQLMLAVPAEAQELWFSVSPGPQGDLRHDELALLQLSLEPANDR